LKRQLGDCRVLENNRLQASPERGLDGGNEARLNLDMVGERSVDRRFEKLRIVESAENSLRAFVESFALFLELAKDLT
jgi:hypothetical protein